jgi:hypothetical protein
MFPFHGPGQSLLWQPWHFAHKSLSPLTGTLTRPVTPFTACSRILPAPSCCLIGSQAEPAITESKGLNVNWISPLLARRGGQRSTRPSLACGYATFKMSWLKEKGRQPALPASRKNRCARINLPFSRSTCRRDRPTWRRWCSKAWSKLRSDFPHTDRWYRCISTTPRGRHERGS